MIDAMITITRDGTSTWILWELRQPPCHLLDNMSGEVRVIEPRFDVVFGLPPHLEFTFSDKSEVYT